MREHSYGEDREPSRARRARGSSRASGASARATCWRCGASTASAAAWRSRPSGSPRASASRRSSSEQWSQPVALADLAVRGDDLIAAGVGEGPAIGAALRRLLAAVVDDPSLNTRETLLRLAIAPESID